MRFALRNFAGNPTAYYRVEAQDLGAQAQVAVKQPSHHILIVDRSGSMYGDIEDLKATVEKLLTLEEFNDPMLRISLLSYSSEGDVKLHFAKVTVADVMKTGSPYLKEVRSIRVTGLTCISQSLVLAETLIDDKETTCVTLHSDGYANDRSPSAEFKAIDVAIAKYKKHPNVFVNTLAYRDWCDFNLLAKVANELSGTCMRVQGIRQAYDALHTTTGMLAGQVAPAVEASIGSASYVTFVSKRANKILGSNATLAVRGLRTEDDKTAYRYFSMTEKEYVASTLPVCGEGAPLDSVLAFCRAQIAENKVNAAKYALVATRLRGLISKHSRAMVTNEIADMATAVEEQLFGTTKALEQPAGEYGLGATGPSLLTLLSVLDSYKDSFRINLKSLKNGYIRRGLRRVAGVRKEDGTLELPEFDTKLREGEVEWVGVSGIEINRNTATANLRVVQPIKLIKRASGEEISEVAGVKLDSLKSFNNYTLVGDGQVNVSEIEVKISDKRLFKALKDMGLVQGDLDPAKGYKINSKDMPLVEYDEQFELPADLFAKLLNSTLVSKILSGMLKEASTSYTADQIAELKKFYLTPSLNVSFPTTTEYTDLQEALSTGSVDSRLSYKIDLGTTTLTGVSKLKSGNEYLQRRFTLEVDGKPVEKPTLDMVPGAKVKWGIKALSGRTKLDTVDEVSYPIYAALLGLETAGSPAGTLLSTILTTAGLDDEACQNLFKAVQGVTTSKDDAVEAITAARKAVDQMQDGLFQSYVCPLAFFVGASGLVPDSLKAEAMTTEQFEQKYPETKLSKDEKEGMFYVLPNGLVLTVYIKSEYFSK